MGREGGSPAKRFKLTVAVVREGRYEMESKGNQSVKFRTGWVGPLCLSPREVSCTTAPC